MTAEFLVGEVVDCLDEMNRWETAEITAIKANRAYVRYLGFPRKYDTWIDITPEKILHQWRHGSEFQLNNRIDVKDEMGSWLEARVMDINELQIKVHFRRYAERFDKWLEKTSIRIAELGTHSRSYGVGRKHQPKQITTRGIQEQIGNKPYIQHNEQVFRELLKLRDMVIVEVEGDGNCLFRSVSHQLYNTSDHHALIRRIVIQYLSLEREYFCQFVIDGSEKFDDYLAYLQRNGAWGDDLEIQAMSEIYNCPVQVFAYSNEPMRTFHESVGTSAPLQISYHGQSHYNSIIVKDRKDSILSSAPGEHEEGFIADIRSNGQRSNEIRDARNYFDSAPEGDLNEAMRQTLAQFDEQGVNPEESKIIENRELEQAVQLSLSNTPSEDPELQAAMQASMQEPNVDPELQAAMQASMAGQTEDPALQAAMQASIRNDEEEQMNAALAASLQQTEIPVYIRQVMEMGFTQQQAREAELIVGKDPQDIIDFLCSQLM